MNKRILIIWVFVTFIFALTACDEKRSVSNTVSSSSTYEEQIKTDSKPADEAESSLKFDSRQDTSVVTSSATDKAENESTNRKTVLQTSTPTISSSQNNQNTTSTQSPDNKTNQVSSVEQTSSTPLPPERECINRPDLARQIFFEINKHRKENGLSELIWVDQNAVYAYNQAWYNAINDVPRKSVHTCDQIGVTGTVYSESSIIPNAINSWKSSPGHNANMLDVLNNRGGAAAIEIKKYGYTAEFVIIVDFDIYDFTHLDRGITIS